MPLLEFRDLPTPFDCCCVGCVAADEEQRGESAAFARSGAARLVTAGAVAVAALVGPGFVHASAAQAAETTGAAMTESGDRTLSPQGAPDSAVGAAKAAQRLTRAQILARAQKWVDARVPYSMSKYRDGYRTDCSGFVSMAWGLSGNHWTGDLDQYGTRISKAELKPGDMLLFHNSASPQRGSHVVLFVEWANSQHTRYTVMEQAGGLGAVKRTIPYAYTSHASSYVPYRYNHLQDGGGTSGDAFPGAGNFGPGADNAHVTRLGTMLVNRGAGRFYQEGPGPRWGAADRNATRAFQEAQGWSGSDADGIPGAATWRLLVEGRGNNIGGGTAPGSPAPGSPAPGFPGTQYFGPGKHNDHVTQLGHQLVKKGFGQSYTEGPGPSWGEADRRAVEAFQRSQGWNGSDADGYPGPHTWRLLFG
ncbi:peptidoglycan-binding protein [Kitasatospora sp. NPDC002227]|uniref:peptidoglycan-binding protein n=1 Tax=Kitasatospora sp. NPDC002227 TaxID=3154773 RepID=UPI00332B9923